jgi:hypothetical protein
MGVYSIPTIPMPYYDVDPCKSVYSIPILRIYYPYYGLISTAPPDSPLIMHYMLNPVYMPVVFSAHRSTLKLVGWLVGWLDKTLLSHSLRLGLDKTLPPSFLPQTQKRSIDQVTISIEDSSTKNKS